MLKEQVGKIEIFKDFSDKQLDELYFWLERREYDEHAEIIKEGAHAQGLYLLAGGIVSVVKRSTLRKVKLTDIVAPSFFGEIGLLNGSARTAAVRAKSKVVIGYLPRQLFEKKLQQDNITALRISLSIGRLLANRLSNTSELLVNTVMLLKKHE